MGNASDHKFKENAAISVQKTTYLVCGLPAPISAKTAIPHLAATGPDDTMRLEIKEMFGSQSTATGDQVGRLLWKITRSDAIQLTS